MKTLLTIFLIASLATMPLNADPKPQSAGGVAVGIGVICLGTVCVIILAKKCAKWFPRNKPANTNELSQMSIFAASYEVEKMDMVQQDNTDEYGASWNFGALGSCRQPNLPGLFDSAGAMDIPTTFVLVIEVLGPQTLRFAAAGHHGPEVAQDWYGFQNDILSHSLLISGIPDGSQYFERNRQPASSLEVPILFGPEPGAVTVDNGGELVRFVVERSTDLIEWEQLLATQYPVGQRLEILDTSIDDSAFYRTRIVP